MEQDAEIAKSIFQDADGETVKRVELEDDTKEVARKQTGFKVPEKPKRSLAGIVVKKNTTKKDAFKEPTTKTTLLAAMYGSDSD
jgi:hypothetical protein